MESGSASGNDSASTGESHAAPGALQLVEVDAHEDDPEFTSENEPPKKQKKSTSKVWQYYEKFWVTTTRPNGVKVKEQWAKCKKCSYKGRTDSTRGTSVFWNHQKYKHSVVKGQQTLQLKKIEAGDTKLETYRYDPESCLRKWQSALVMHGYPLNMVEHEYFVDFIKSLWPDLSLNSCTTKNNIMETFEEEMEKLYNLFKSISCRFSCTMDVWTSYQNKRYMCIAVHWIDGNWHMQKRIVKFMHVKGEHTGQNLASKFVKGVMDMNLEKKLFSLTLDNASNNDKCVEEIIPILSKHAPLVCDGVFFHVRCVCHILNLVAQDGLNKIASSVHNIRQTIAIVKSSPLQWEEFQKCALECELDVTRGLSLDLYVSTRWNSTFAMLKTAVYFKSAFERLMLLNGTKYQKCAPTDEDWDRVQSLAKCLQKFSDATDLFSGHSYPTANLFWWKICSIKLAIVKWSHDCDVTISTMAKAMQEKYEKYWDKSKIALAVACFFDPRYKTKLVDYFMRKIYHDDEMYDCEFSAFMDVVNQLFQSYNTIKHNAQSTQTIEVSEPCSPCSFDLELEEYLYGTSGAGHIEENELEKYMKEPVPFSEPNDEKFDVLEWWRCKQWDFPVLSQLARDVLGIQVSTVTSDSPCSAGGRVVNPFHSKLEPEMIEALICIKDWSINLQRADRL